ncbi:MAG: hypothetical protein Q4G71_12705, partial [Pseudomonadota bacterium]|nr:hypothetical protein [Pseudomonadota bacterium]
MRSAISGSTWAPCWHICNWNDINIAACVRFKTFLYIKLTEIVLKLTQAAHFFNMHSSRRPSLRPACGFAPSPCGLVYAYIFCWRWMVFDLGTAVGQANRLFASANAHDGVIPAQAGIQPQHLRQRWIPACAGMTGMDTVTGLQRCVHTLAQRGSNCVQSQVFFMDISV